MNMNILYFIKYSIKIRNIEKNFNSQKHNKIELLVYDVKYKQKKSLEKVSRKSSKYIYNCFKIAINLIKNKILAEKIGNKHEKL